MVASPEQPFTTAPPATLLSMVGEPLSIALREPFVIASGRIDVTRAVLVRATVVDDATGRQATGLGEAAALPPVTVEDQPDLLRAVAGAAQALRGLRFSRAAELTAALESALPQASVARAGIEAAVIDAWARLTGAPLHRLLRRSPPGTAAATHAAPTPPIPLITDITLPISPPEHMARLAMQHLAAGFDCFKVKVGRDWRADRACLRAVAQAVPQARFRLDANAGFSAANARALLDGVLSDGLCIECYEQPCAADDWSGMAEVTAHASVPVVADESFRGAGDLEQLLRRRAAHAVNLKLVKLGGPLPTLALARAARAAGLRLMAGAMVETRVGLLAMAHVVTALGGVDWVDLDTAFLLAEDPFQGGWTVRGPNITLTDGPGLAVECAPAPSIGTTI
ncbi:MAG: enolase C-terminal domain-like protein [Myxococcales bacterium]